MVLDSDKENEAECLINVQGPNAQREHTVKVSNANNEETRDLNLGREIRDGPLQLNINIPENFDNSNNNTICTPRYTYQMENV